MKQRIGFVAAFMCLTAVAFMLSGGAGAGTGTTGNGAPNGSHYNLNIIGVPKDKSADMTGNTGGRIFVRLNGGEDATSLNGKPASSILDKANMISLTPAPAGESFRVLDANATDSGGAAFQLPADVSGSWTVWARALGTPGGSAVQTTCADSFLDAGLIFCSEESAMYFRTKGTKSTFADVTDKLLFLTLTVDSTATPGLASCLGVSGTKSVTLSLFNSCLENYFWNYQNDGLKLLQLRFYPAS
jgi:hypothetical protein